MNKYIEIQQDAIQRYKITLCYGEYCKDDWSRTHVHPRKRMICKWYPKNSIQSTFELLHEIGHIENNHSKMRRCEEEYYATVWAIDIAEQVYYLKIPPKIIKDYQEYIKMEYDRGIRRYGNLPPYENFILKETDEI